MMARCFKPVGWVAAVAGAALGCYMLSLNVAAERAELANIERKIVATKQDIRSLQTELGTRGRMAQLDRWNADVLALSSPLPAQFLDDAFTLARFEQPGRTVEERATVHMASLETGAAAAAKPETRIAPADYAAAAAARTAEAPPQPLVRRASLVVENKAPLARMEPAPPPVPAAKPDKAKKPGLLDDRLVAEIGAAARSERAARGPGAQ
jgi:hypothetical protein